MYVGRESENRFLNHYYATEGSQILVVYGQKGVGKTTLLRHFIKDKSSSYYLARSCSEREQRYQWGCELNSLGNATSRYPSYQEIFNTVMPASVEGKQVLIIDEFHHLVKSDDQFIPELISFIKSRVQSDHCFVLLCTSASGWVENSMISKIGSDAASLSGLLKVRELRFADMVKLFPEYTTEDSMQIYAALGGIPGLWNSFDVQLSAKENIIHNIINPYSRLHNEMSVYMSEELREPAVYNTILATISKGSNKLNDIFKHTGFSRAKISVYLKNLMELDMVEKMFSFESGGYANTKKGIYRVSNPYVRFYFKFLYPNLSKLQEIGFNDYYHQYVEDFYPMFVEEAYRKVCREQIAGQYVSMGEWIGKSGDLDIVAKDAQGHMMVAMCSYSKKITYEDYEWLLFQMEQAQIKADTIRLFSEKGFDERVKAASIKEHFILQSILSE